MPVTRSIEELKAVSCEIQKAALEAADPAKAVSRFLTGRDWQPAGRLVVVAVGKAAVAMSGATLNALGPAVTASLIVIPHGYPGERVLHAGHPLPDEAGLEAAREILAIVNGMEKNDVCLFLLSGGSSSLLPNPPAGVSLADLVATTSLLLKSGANINEVNAVRKHLSGLSGGRLAAYCEGTIVTLAISDVVGDDLAIVGSGPTVADPSTFSDAIGVLERHAILLHVPASVRTHLTDGAAARVPETPKTLPARHAAFLVASSALSVQAAAEAARARGFVPHVLTEALTGEARAAGKTIAAAARQSRLRGRPVPAPCCLIAAGETTVTVTGGGIGGRNQELALSAAFELRAEPGILLTSFATDGQEGNSDAAGAYASAETLASGSRAGLDALSCLEQNDAFTFLQAAGDLIRTGPTGTNVNDITFVLVD